MIKSSGRYDFFVCFSQIMWDWMRFSQLITLSASYNFLCRNSFFVFFLAVIFYSWVLITVPAFNQWLYIWTGLSDPFPVPNRKYPLATRSQNPCYCYFFNMFLPFFINFFLYCKLFKWQIRCLNSSRWNQLAPAFNVQNDCVTDSPKPAFKW